MKVSFTLMFTVFPPHTVGNAGKESCETFVQLLQIATCYGVDHSYKFRTHG